MNIIKQKAAFEPPFCVIFGRRVSRRRSGLKAVAPAPICGQQIGQMRVQEHNSPRKKRKSNQT
jgi:hypothetical protein